MERDLRPDLIARWRVCVDCREREREWKMESGGEKEGCGCFLKSFLAGVKHRCRQETAVNFGPTCSLEEKAFFAFSHTLVGPTRQRICRMVM